MIRYATFGALTCLLFAPLAPGQQNPPGKNTVLGRLASGATVTFVRSGPEDWGIEISGGSGPRLIQQKPAQIEVDRGGENVGQLAAGYQSVQKEGDSVIAKVKTPGGGEAAFVVEDRWNVSATVFSLSRKVSVIGAENDTGRNDEVPTLHRIVDRDIS